MSSKAGQMDGLIVEGDELLDRVAYLERKMTSQAEELTCLKSALADCLRRVQLLESSRGTNSSSNHAAPRTASETRASRPPAATVSPNPTSRRTSRMPSTSNARRPPSQASVNLLSPSGGVQPGLKASSVMGPVARSSAASKSGSREPAYLHNDGILRMCLNGRFLNFYAPTDIAANYDFAAVLPAPEEHLKLEWVYGYRGKDCRNNIFLLPTGEIIYFIAAVVVLYHLELHSQRHYLEHNDDVKCLAIHPDRITVASGQTSGHSKCDGKPHVRIWNSVSLETLHVIGQGVFESSIACLAFSRTDGGAILTVIDEASDHTISVWGWQKERRLTETKSSTEPVIAVEFNPIDANSIVTIGKNHLAFWTLDGSNLTKKQCVFEKYEKPKFVLSMVFADNGDLITGDSNGNIFVWSRGLNKITHAVLGVHSGGIFALTFSKDGNLLSGGGRDSRVVQLDASLNPTGVYVELSAWYGPVRTLIAGPGDLLIVGTTQGKILQGNLGMEFSPLIQSHADEFWALTAHPQSHQFLTGGRDGSVFLWDSLTRQLVWAENISEEVVCAAFYPAVVSPDTTQAGAAGVNLPDTVPVVALGTNSGRWIILDAVLHQIITAHHESSEAIQCVAYSPNGRFIAFGGRDNSIYVYNVTERGSKYSRHGKCAGHSSFVLHMDWSEDSQYLRSVSGDYELIFWSVANCRQVTSSSSMRDIRWATQCCHLGFEVAGIWSAGFDGTDINAACRSHSTRLLATADDLGRVNLFRYPASQLISKSRSYGGHSSHVTNVDFLFDDSRLISSGGADMAILQWEVIV